MTNPQDPNQRFQAPHPGQPGQPYQQPGQPYQQPPGQPYQQFPGQQYAAGAPQYQPPKKRKVWPWILGALVLLAVLFFASCAALFGKAADEVSKGGGSSNPGATASLGQPVRDGKFEFTVKGVECGVESIGEGALAQQAQGQFCLLDLTITNTGDKAQTMFGNNQKLLDAAGKEYSADTSATMFTDDSKAVFSEINPGNTVSGKIAFDVPQGVTPVAAVLHDSMFSNGVKVNL